MASDCEVNVKRLILAEVRGGDFAHVGEVEAIDRVWEVFNELRGEIDLEQLQVLDVGCGFGGTLEYFHKMGFERCVGIDILGSSIGRAREHYPEMEFYEMDALRMSEELELRGDGFDFVYLMNVIYAVQQKPRLLAEIWKVMAPGGVVVLFDYTSGSKKNGLAGKVDFSGIQMEPMNREEMMGVMEELGIESIGSCNMTDEFIVWYELFLKKLQSDRGALLEKGYLVEDIEGVRLIFEEMVRKLKGGELGGGMVWGRVPYPTET